MPQMPHMTSALVDARVAGKSSERLCLPPSQIGNRVATDEHLPTHEAAVVQHPMLQEVTNESIRDQPGIRICVPQQQGEVDALGVVVEVAHVERGPLRLREGHRKMRVVEQRCLVVRVAVGHRIRHGYAYYKASLLD